MWSKESKDMLEKLLLSDENSWKTVKARISLTPVGKCYSVDLVTKVTSTNSSGQAREVEVCKYF